MIMMMMMMYEKGTIYQQRQVDPQNMDEILFEYSFSQFDTIYIDVYVWNRDHHNHLPSILALTLLMVYPMIHESDDHTT
jgi:hypothetical protein